MSTQLSSWILHQLFFTTALKALQQSQLNEEITLEGASEKEQKLLQNKTIKKLGEK
jgi:hypothetical protein